MPTYSSPKPTLTLTSRFIGQNVGFVGGGGGGGGVGGQFARNLN